MEHDASRTLHKNATRILVAGIHYAPEDSGIAPYTQRFAEHLVQSGRDVTVLTGLPHLPHWTVHPGYRTKRLETIGGVRVVRSPHFVPQRQSAAARARLEASFFIGALKASASLTKPDLIVAVIPALAGGAIANLLSRRWGVPYLLWIQDLVGNSASQSGISGGSAVARVTSATETFIARGARRIGVVAPAFERVMVEHKIPAEKIWLLRNWTHVAPPTVARSSIREEMGWSRGETIVLHAGNMGLKQGLESVIEAARRAATTLPNVRFILMGGGNQQGLLAAAADGLPNVSFKAPVAKDQLTNVLAAADILLVNERPSVVDMSLPSKLTSYFAAGRPVLAAVPDHGTTASELRAAGAGLVVSPADPSALLQGVIKLQTDGKLAESLVQSARVFLTKHLTEESALSRLEAFIDLSGPN